MRRRLLLPLFIAVFGMGTAAGFLMPSDDLFALRKNFEIYGAIYEALIDEYVDPLNPDRLMQSGVEAMLSDLDPYTNFMNEADRMDAVIQSRGQYGSVGLELGRRANRLTVTAPREGASAYKQGVRAGDVILRIAGQPAAELTLQDAQTLLQGEPGTTVTMTVERDGVPDPVTFTLTREQVDLASVSYAGFVDDDTAAGLGYVKLDRFGETAGSEVREALEQLQQPETLRGLVLDLRDNPGGLMQAAVEITGLFVPEGSKVVSMRGRTPESERVFRSRQAPLAPDLPLVILVNELSASASEIVAGAVQDLDRGVIVGTTTYGKGLVQTIKDLPYNTSLKLTLARYYTPSGRSIQSMDYSRHDGTAAEIPDSLRQTHHTAGGRPVQAGSGIEPDVTAGAASASPLEEALQRRAAFFFFANDYAARHDRLPDDFAVTDQLLQDFERWVGEQDFDYESSAEQTLDRLARQLDEAGYGLGSELTDLQNGIHREKQSDFERHADRLRRQLHREILSRYQSEHELIKATLRLDPEMQEALRLLDDTSAYGAVLH